MEIRTCVTDGDVIIPSEDSVLQLQSLNLQPKTSSISFYYMIHNFLGVVFSFVGMYRCSRLVSCG